jgi:Ca-activated chloride channel homolog
MELSRLEFAQPAWLWLLPVILLVYIWMRRNHQSIVVSDIRGWNEAFVSWRIRLMWLVPLLLNIGIGSWIVAASSPRIGNRQTEIKKDGIAMMMVVDTSSSMLALDLSGTLQEETRLDVVKKTVVNFVQGGDGFTGRSNDMVGLIRFAGFADTSCPLTFDHLNLSTITQNIEIVTNPEEDGTAIGEALTLAVSRLTETTAESKVIVLLTDGSNNAGQETPEVAASLAKSQNIVIYSIGVGSNGMAPIRIRDPRSGRSQIRTIPVQIDDELLESISTQTGGRYFRATNREGLQQIVETIDTLEKTTLEEKRYREYTEYFPLLLLFGLLSLGVSIVLQHTIFRRVA